MAAKSKKSKSKKSGKGSKKQESSSGKGGSPKQGHKKQSSQKVSNIRMAVAVIILAALVLMLVFYDEIAPSDSGEGNAVAEVNGEQITEQELNEMYNRVPQMYKMSGLTKDKFLTETLIPQKLLLQEAERRGVTATDAEVDAMINNTLQASGTDLEGLKSQLSQQNITYEEFRQLTKDQITMNKLMNQSLEEIEIPEQEIEDFYTSNKEMFATGNNTYAALEDVGSRIRDYLANQKFMQELKESAEISIYLEESNNSQGNSISGSVVAGPDDPAQGEAGDSSAGADDSGTSFKTSSSEVCTEEGKPVVALFSTTSCPHCSWIGDTFDKVVKDYAEEGSIAAYHWQFDSKDNILTPDVEGSVPEEHISMFREYSPQGGVPAFVFGCKYYRVGNAYERSGDLQAEEEEFRAVIEKLLSEA